MWSLLLYLRENQQKIKICEFRGNNLPQGYFQALLKMEMVLKVLCVEEFWSLYKAALAGPTGIPGWSLFQVWLNGSALMWMVKWGMVNCVRSFCVQALVFVPMHLSRWQARFCLRPGQRNQVAFKSDARVKTHHWAEKQNKTEMHREPISCLIKTLQPGLSLGWGLGTGSKSPKLRVFSLSLRNKNASLTVGKLPPALQTLPSLHHTEGASEVGTAISPFFR